MAIEDDRQKKIINSMAQFIITTDLQGKITFANNSAQNVIKCASAIQQNEYFIESLLTGLDFSVQKQKEFLDKIENSPQNSIQIESKLMNSTNEPIWIRWTVQRLFASTNSSPEILFNGTDISQEKQLEQTLKTTQEIQEDYHQLFNKIDGAFSRHKLIFDTAGKPINYTTYDINDQYEKILEVKRERILGKPLLGLSERITLEPFDWLAIFSQVAITGQPISFVQYLAHIKKYLQIHVYSVKSGYFDVLSFDITENQIIEQHMNRMQKMDALNHYYRAMSSWAILTAATGFKLDIPHQRYSIIPMKSITQCKAPWFSPTGWGMFNLTESQFEITCLEGSLSFKELRIKAKFAKQSIIVGNQTIQGIFEYIDGITVVHVDSVITINTGQQLAIK